MILLDEKRNVHQGHVTTVDGRKAQVELESDVDCDTKFQAIYSLGVSRADLLHKDFFLFLRKLLQGLKSLDDPRFEMLRKFYLPKQGRGVSKKTFASAMFGLTNTLLAVHDAASSQTTLVDASSIRSHGSHRSSSSVRSWGSDVTLVSNGSDIETLANDGESALELDFAETEGDEEDEVPIEDHRGYRQVHGTLLYP